MPRARIYIGKQRWELKTISQSKLWILFSHLLHPHQAYRKYIWLCFFQGETEEHIKELGFDRFFTYRPGYDIYFLIPYANTLHIFLQNNKVGAPLRLVSYFIVLGVRSPHWHMLNYFPYYKKNLCFLSQPFDKQGTIFCQTRSADKYVLNILIIALWKGLVKNNSPSSRHLLTNWKIVIIFNKNCLKVLLTLFLLQLTWSKVLIIYFYIFTVCWCAIDRNPAQEKLCLDFLWNRLQNWLLHGCRLQLKLLERQWWMQLYCPLPTPSWWWKIKISSN